MTRTLGLIITLGALAVGGLVAAQNTTPSPQNVAPPAPSAAPGPAPGPAAGPPPGGGGQKRIALVVGNSGYQAAPLKTAANDAGLIAQTLQAAGFDVAGARDLDQESTRRALRDFLDKAQGSGPDTAAFIYLSGYGVQFEGENYFVPIDAKLARAADVPVEAVRMSDYTRPLAAMNLKANIVVLDAGRANPFAKSGPPLAGGLALVDAEPGTLIAFNAAPGTVAPDGDGPYGAYAQALAEMIRDGGLQPADIFNRVRLRVNETTKGAEVPWQSANIKAPFEFFERAADAPPPPVSAQQAAEVRSRPIRDIGPQDAYAAVLERDTLQGYTDFLAAYPDDPMAGRVRAIVAARREALTWRRTRIADTPDGYWSYLRRYARGPHLPDAERRLAELRAALQPPPTFAALAYDVPPPPPDEIVYVDRPVLYFSDPVFAFAPPPPPPVIFLAPRLAFWVALPPPPPPIGVFVLPIPVYQPIPIWVRPPAYIAPPPSNNIIYNNVHNTVIVNNTTNNVTIRNAAGQTTTQPIAVAAAAPGAPAPAAGTAPAAGAAPATVGPALPPSVATRAAALHGAGTPASATPGAPGTPGTPGAPGTPGTPGAPGTAGAQGAPVAASQPPHAPLGQSLPGAKGQQPLPPAAGAPTAALPGGQPPAHGQPPAPGAAPTAALPAGQAPAHGQPPGAAPTTAAPGGPAPAHGQPAAPGTAPTAALPPGQAHALPVPGAAGQPPTPVTSPSANLPTGHQPQHGGPPAGGPSPTANLPGSASTQPHGLPSPGATGGPAPTGPGTAGHAPSATPPTAPHPSALAAPTPPPQIHAAPPAPVPQHAAPPSPAPQRATPSAPAPLANVAPRALPPPPPVVRPAPPPPAAARPAPPPPQMRAAAPPPPPPRAAAPPPPRPAAPAAKPAGKPACGGPGQPHCG
jgi:uncharacterized caspase-like protein